ncbi:flagellar hook-associated family protein [Pseudaminobacter sp. 19-2017]|uniref:Flagellin n=1 Tax=Pseudaminobacter soli (ex Zhang et al. 2022) TaxID=2831468 RepID=A0A942E3B6_9HYPH|nr:flagellar hook-associated family protein [Pseudaminobacter soli]MBS3650348.1 flagellar hook-associated family protein [Pseudaminobacter soli]
MKTTSVSTAALSQSLRYSLMRSQSELTRNQKELQTGLVADTGLALGVRTAQTVTFSRDFERMQGIVNSNNLISGRLEMTQEALKRIQTAAQTFLTTLTASSSGSATIEVTRASASTMLEQLTGILNTSFNGEYVFAGTNTDVRPLDDFTAPASPSKAAFDAAFLAHFGFTQSDPATATITASQMDIFLSTAVEPQFLGAGWSANWSAATDQSIISRITLTETTKTSVSANDDTMRKVAMASATLSELFTGDFGPGARKVLVDRAITLVAETVLSLGDLQARTGIIEKRVSDASDRLNVQMDLFEKQLGNMLIVDPYEAQVRVSELLNHIELSYALTSRIQQLSLLRFIS